VANLVLRKTNNGIINLKKSFYNCNYQLKEICKYKLPFNQYVYHLEFDPQIFTFKMHDTEG